MSAVLYFIYQPRQYYSFKGWSGQWTGSSPTFTITMDSDKNEDSSSRPEIINSKYEEEKTASWVEPLKLDNSMKEIAYLLN